jgi:hypothetical protein
MPAGADVLATDELEGCEIGDEQVGCAHPRRGPALSVARESDPRRSTTIETTVVLSAGRKQRGALPGGWKPGWHLAG